MVYVLGILGVIIAVVGIWLVITAIRSMQEDTSKLPLFLQSFASGNKAMAGFFAVAAAAIAVLGGWMAYKGFTGG
jgi:hypothetical protein